MERARPALVALLAAALYDSLVRPRLLDWGATGDEHRRPLPGDAVVAPVMTHHTRAVTIEAPPEAVWPWLVQIGDRRAGFYSYDWVERVLFLGTVHYVEPHHSASRIHPELQHPALGDHINTGSIGRRLAIGNPITVIEPDHALVIGTWAFILEPLPGGRTRLLVRERDTGWCRLAAPRHSGLLRMVGAAIDYAVGEPLHFAMVRKMMLGLKTRAEMTSGPSAPADRLVCSDLPHGPGVG